PTPRSPLHPRYQAPQHYEDPTGPIRKAYTAAHACLPLDPVALGAAAHAARCLNGPVEQARRTTADARVSMAKPAPTSAHELRTAVSMTKPAPGTATTAITVPSPASRGTSIATPTKPMPSIAVPIAPFTPRRPPPVEHANSAAFKPAACKFEPAPCTTAPTTPSTRTAPSAARTTLIIAPAPDVSAGEPCRLPPAESKTTPATPTKSNAASESTITRATAAVATVGPLTRGFLLRTPTQPLPLASATSTPHASKPAHLTEENGPTTPPIPPTPSITTHTTPFAPCTLPIFKIATAPTTSAVPIRDKSSRPVPGQPLYREPVHLATKPATPATSNAKYAWHATATRMQTPANATPLELVPCRGLENVKTAAPTKHVTATPTISAAAAFAVKPALATATP
ncbi:hypothetical protein H0H81_005420, partial [Sphagnurus paluster]